MTAKKPSRLLQSSHLRRDAHQVLPVLHRLVELGGRATRQRLRESFSYDQIFSAMTTLLRRNFAMEEDAVIVLTPIGKAEEAYHAMLDGADKFGHEPVPVVAPAPVLVSRIAVFKPLRLSSVSGPIRVGKDDHLQIPSLMGGVRKLPGGEVLK